MARTCKRLGGMGNLFLITYGGGFGTILRGVPFFLDRCALFMDCIFHHVGVGQVAWHSVTLFTICIALHKHFWHSSYHDKIPCLEAWCSEW